MSSSRGMVDNIPKSVIDWLFQNVQKIYRLDPRTTFHDSLLALSTFKQTLRPRTRVYINESGQSKLLLCLYGKIGNVPVLVWVHDEYPVRHPLCYIDMDSVEDKEMIINVGRHVDSNGQLYLPIFQNWNDKQAQCNIINTVKDLEQVVRTETLLRRKQPLLPPKYGRQPEEMRASPVVDSSRPPPIPQRPRMNAPPAIPTPPPRVVSTSPVVRTPPAIPAPPPPKEKKPTPLVLDLMDSDAMNTTTTTHQDKIDELSAILARLDLQESQTISTVHETRSTKINDTIAQFDKTLQYETGQLSTIRQQLAQSKETLQDKITELDQLQTHLQKFDSPTIHITETIGLNQLYTLVSQDEALTDTIFLLSELLNNGQLPIDNFTKRTRALAKRQFLIRLQIEKIYNLLQGY